MKRIISFFAIALCCSSLAFSQVSMTKNTHGFLPQEEHESVCVEYQDPGAAGVGQVWDYSNAAILNEEKSYFSQIELNEENGNIQVKRSDNISFFFHNTEKGNEYMGYRSGSQQLVLDQPIYKTSYPQVYGTFFDGRFSGQFVYDNSDRKSYVKGYYSTHVDATGTLLLPEGKSLEVIRVYTTEKWEYTNSTQVIEKYLWYAQDVRYPVFVTIDSYMESGKGSVSCHNTRSFYNPRAAQVVSAPTVIDAVEATIAYTVNPNPFTDRIEVSYNLPEATTVSVELYNSVGAKLVSLVDKQTQSGYVTLSENIAKYTPNQDIYILKLTFGDKVYTEKLIKSAN